MTLSWLVISEVAMVLDNRKYHRPVIRRTKKPLLTTSLQVQDHGFVGNRVQSLQWGHYITYNTAMGRVTRRPELARTALV